MKRLPTFLLVVAGLVLGSIPAPAEPPPSACYSWYPSPSLGDPMTKRYDAPGPGTAVVSMSDPNQEDGSFDVGGASFPSLNDSRLGGVWGAVCLVVLDDVSPLLLVSICQPSLVENVCIGIEWEEREHPYYRRNGQSSAVAVRRDRPITVIVHGPEPCISWIFFAIPVPCGVSGGTSGTITIQEIE
jgi:hypothetical protein